MPDQLQPRGITCSCWPSLATAASALAAADIFTIYGRNFDSVLTSWFYGHALGMAIMLPAVLLIARPEMVRDFRRSP